MMICLPYLSVLLYWMALPPLNLWPLALLAPMLWCRLIRLPKLPGKRPYAHLWTAGFLFWLANTWWVVLPHPVLTLGWIAMSAYLAIYLPFFVAVARVAIYDYRLKPMVAAPVVWCGVEFMRKHLFGGFALGSLEHAFYQTPIMIQIADLGGEHLLGMLCVFIGCGFDCLIPVVVDPEKRTPRLGFFNRRLPLGSTGRQWSPEPLVYAMLLLAGTLLYGHFDLL